MGKSCKPIPVMLLGVLIGRKKYSLQKYLFVFMIVTGVALFIYKDTTKAKSDSLSDKSPLSDSVSMIGTGELLLVSNGFKHL